MKLKILIIVGILALALPAVSLAQNASSPTTTGIDTTPPTTGTGSNVTQPVPASTGCAMPVNPTLASDWTSVVVCLQSRIDKLEAKIVQLESENRVYPVLPPPASATATQAVQGIKNSMENTKAIQEFLKEKGFFLYPTATGYYGPITEQAVKAFQEKEGIEATGEIDDNTLEKIKALAPTVAPSVGSAIEQIESESKKENQNKKQDQSGNSGQSESKGDN